MTDYEEIVRLRTKLAEVERDRDEAKRIIAGMDVERERAAETARRAEQYQRERDEAREKLAAVEQERDTAWKRARESWEAEESQFKAAWQAAAEQAKDFIQRHADERTARKQAESALAQMREENARLTSELQLGHARIDECDTQDAKGQPIRERISAVIQRLVEEQEELRHLLAATGHEKDEQCARAEAANNRRIAAEYRARRIVLDADLQQRAEQAEARLAQVRETLSHVIAQLAWCETETAHGAETVRYALDIARDGLGGDVEVESKRRDCGGLKSKCGHCGVRLSAETRVCLTADDVLLCGACGESLLAAEAPTDVRARPCEAEQDRATGGQ